MHTLWYTVKSLNEKKSDRKRKKAAHNEFPGTLPLVTHSSSLLSLDISILMRYGYSIPKTCKAIQERVKSAIENMVGLTVSVVNVHVVGVDTNTTR